MTALRRLRWPKFLKPTNPTDAYQLALLVLLVGGGIGYAIHAVLPGNTPWNERADTICLDADNAILEDRETRTEKLRREVEIMTNETSKLERISTPNAFVLAYGSMVGAKREEVDVLRKELARAQSGAKPLPEQKLLGVQQRYEYAAREARLDVCGQGASHG